MRGLSIGLLGVLLAGSMSACEPPPTQIQPVITGLAFPAAFTVDPNNVSIWYAERNTGEIRRRNLLTGSDVLAWTVPNVVTTGEQGLLGLTLHPQYPSTAQLFAYAVRNVGGVVRNQVLRINLDRNNGFRGTSQTVVYDQVGGATHHVGGRLSAGTDGNIWFTIGDNTVPANSQDLSTAKGKIMRMTPGGGVPSGNPFGNRVFAFGVRNSFGFDFDPANGRLWATDNGPACNDEVNRVTAGANLAWGPAATCATPPAAPQNTNQNGSNRVLPQRFWANPEGITGAAFCDDCGIDGLERRLLVGEVNTGRIRVLGLNGDRTGISSDQVLVDHNQGVLSLETRPGEPVYFSTSTGIFRLAPA
jgi:glucose/arabinose dehydrogenase